MTFQEKSQSTPLPERPLGYPRHRAKVSDHAHARHYLLPGKVFASVQAMDITTIVGSGVALCLWDSMNGIGGAVHFLLPTTPDNEPGDTRYGNDAGDLLLKLLLDLGVRRSNLQAKIFGGLQPAFRFANSRACVGSRNVGAALKFLAVKRIRLVSKEVGGDSSRRVIFHTDDGETWWESL